MKRPLNERQGIPAAARSNFENLIDYCQGNKGKAREEEEAKLRVGVQGMRHPARLKISAPLPMNGCIPCHPIFARDPIASWSTLLLV